MRELLTAGVGILIQLTVFFCIGSLLMHKLKMEADTSQALIFGYLLYFAVFEILAVPMTLTWVPLKVLAWVWAVILAVVVCCAMFFLRKQWRKQVGQLSHIWKCHSFLFLLVIGVVVLQCLIVVLYQDTTVDAAYYVGTVNTSVYTGTLGRYNPYTGLIYKNFQARYIFSAYPMNNAVWCQLTGAHALIQSKIVMSLINVLMANLIIYQIGKRLFKGGKRQADLLLCFVCLLQLFSYTIYTSGTFFFTRSYEGKALIANVTIPVVLYCSIWFWQKEKDRNLWIMLFLASASAVAFSGSAIIFPFVISAGVLPVMLVKKQFSRFIPYVVCMLPTILYAAVYFAARSGLLTLRAS